MDWLAAAKKGMKFPDPPIQTPKKEPNTKTKEQKCDECDTILTPENTSSQYYNLCDECEKTP